MGNWPDIFDRSATLTLDDGRRLFVCAPHDLRDIRQLIADHQTTLTRNAVCCAFQGRQLANSSKASELLRSIGDSFKYIHLAGQDMADKVNDYVRSGKLLALPLPPGTPVALASQMIIHQQMAMGRALGVTLRDLPDPGSIDLENPNVPAMSPAHRMMWITMRCGEILQKTGKADIAAAFKQLLEPRVLLTVVAGLIVWAASHAIGVGFLIDIAMVVVIGVAVLQAFDVMWDIHKIITRASNKADLDRAANMLAGVVISLGIGTFLAIVTRGAMKSKFRTPPSRSGKTGDGMSSGGGTTTPSRKKSPAEAKKNETTKKDDKKVAGAVPSKPVPCFDQPSGVTDDDFRDQLKEQGDAINSTKPQDLIDRRAKIHDIHKHNAPINDNIKALLKAGGSDAEIKALQKTKRSTEELRDRAQQLAAKESYVDTETKRLLKSGKKKAEIDQIIKSALKELDATHALDIIAGGDPSDISGMNSRRVNRSLGPQWKGTRSKALEDYAKKMKTAGKPMNVELEKCKKK